MLYRGAEIRIFVEKNTHAGPLGGGVIVHSAWGCVLWVAQWRAARALDPQLEGLVGPV